MEVLLNPTLNEKFRYIDEYNTFMYNEAINQNSMRYEINNLLLESGLEVIIQEASLWENIKEFLSKIMKKIGGLFGKFLEHMNKLFMNDKSYLEHYKDIILKKTPVETEFTDFYNYDINMLLHEMVIPDFNENMIESLESEEKFINSSYFSKFMKNKNNTLADNLYATIRGAALTVSSTDTTKVNMTNLFNYCYTYESDMKPNIQKDQKTLNNASVEATNAINNAANLAKDQEEKEKAEKEKMEREAEAKKREEENKAEENNVSTGPNGAPTIQNNSVTISSFDQYFSELSIGSSKQSNGKGSASIGDTSKMPGKNIKNINNDNIEKTKSFANDLSNNKDLSSEAIKKLQDAVSTYFTVCGSVIAAKLTLSQEIYKSYMSIIRWHVQQFTGTNPETDKTQQAASTNASDNNKDTSGNTVKNNPDSTSSTNNNDNNGNKENTAYNIFKSLFRKQS